MYRVLIFNADLSYAMPLLARIIARFTGHAHVLEGPYSLGKWGVTLNVIGFVFLLFTSITFNFPTVNPVDQGNMNYTSAAIGIIGLISIVTWLTTGRKHFTGPQVGVENVNIVKEPHGPGEKGDSNGSGSYGISFDNNGG